MQDFSLRLKKLRKSRGLNQDELAQLLGVRKTTISNYETGYSKPSNSTLRQIADFFGVTIGELLGETLVMREDSGAPGDMKHIPIYTSLSSNGLRGAIPQYHCSLPAALLGEGDFFALRLTDERMNRARLSADSLALVRRQDFADDGDIVLAVQSDGMMISGRYYRNSEGFVLTPESDNSVYRPMVFSAGGPSVSILGKIIKSLETVI
ncbi:MAG: helix-turn-helix domain-containing protein [Ruminococcaceae bacterium]|nr:helix-turn-helix domain-containing protein [Oscillospiraceae bacterium]